MELKSLAKEWRIWILAVVLGVSVVSLGPTPQDTNNDGAFDTYSLTGLNGSMGIDFTGGSQLTLKVQNNQSEQVASTVANILEERIGTLGLGGSVTTRDVGGEPRISVTTPVTNTSRVAELIAQEGSFRADMPFIVRNSKEITVKDTYSFSRENGSVMVSQGNQTLSTLDPGESVEAGETRFFYLKDEGETSLMSVRVYDNQDIQGVRRSAQMGYGVSGSPQSGFEATIPLTISIDAEQRMKDVAQNYRSSRGTLVMEDGRTANLTIYIDSEEITAFSVSDFFRSSTTRNPTINLNGDNADDLRTRMKRVEGYLESGNLPEPVEVVGRQTISSNIGGQFMTASVLSIIGALIAVGFIVFLRYRNPRLVLPIVFTGASEVFVLIGLWFTNFATLTLSAVAGIIAAVGTGVDDQIIIADESEEEQVKDWTQKMKTAFFVIFTSAASTIGAMIPILSPNLSTTLIGAGSIALLAYNFYTDRSNSHYIAAGILGLTVAFASSTFNLTPLESIKEFATTTIVGILVGISVTRPAFAKILESMEK